MELREKLMTERDQKGSMKITSYPHHFGGNDHSTKEPTSITQFSKE